jgi:hypothetical protein
MDIRDSVGMQWLIRQFRRSEDTGRWAVWMLDLGRSCRLENISESRKWDF